MRQADRVQEKMLGWLEITGWRNELAGAKSSLEVYIK
jgi:hypothetical protein